MSLDEDGLFDVVPVVPRPQARAAAVDKRFRAFDPHQVLLLPQSLDDWPPEDHLARSVVDLFAPATPRPPRPSCCWRT